MPNTFSRNQRNNPYMVETYAVKFHHSMAGLLWRWRTELTLITAAAWACWRLATVAGWSWQPRLSLSDALPKALENNPELQTWLNDAGYSTSDPTALDAINLH